MDRFQHGELELAYKLNELIDAVNKQEEQIADMWAYIKGETTPPFIGKCDQDCKECAVYSDTTDNCEFRQFSNKLYTPKPEGQMIGGVPQIDIPKGYIRATMHGLEEFDGNHWHPHIGKNQQ